MPTTRGQSDQYSRAVFIARMADFLNQFVNRPLHKTVSHQQFGYSNFKKLISRVARAERGQSNWQQREAHSAKC